MNRFAIRRIRKPAIVSGLASTVVVNGNGFVEIAFNEKLLAFVGKTLPRGVCADDPAFMSVTFDKEQSTYVVSVQYVASGQRFKLWIMAEKPKWLNHVKQIDGIKRKNHGSDS